MRAWKRLCVSVAVAATLAFLTVNSASAAPAATPAPSKTDAPAASPDAKDYQLLTKEATQQTGLFTIWRKDDKLFLELRDDQLEKDYLEHIVPANGLGGFGFHSGEQFQQLARIVRFERRGKHIVMVWPHTRFQAQDGTPLGTAVDESTTGSVEALLPIIIENKAGGSVVVDLSPLLGDMLDLGNQLSDAVKNPENPEGGYGLDPTRTYFGPSKDFPKNVLIEAEQTFRSAKPDTINTVPDERFVEMRVKYNIAELMSSPDYKPRLYDDRVGYFDDPHVVFDDDRRQDNHLWDIVRWDVEPSDPSQRLSPPKRPIVFYLDHSIPLEYRATVRAGILEWNKAFERIGVSNAIQVLDAPDDPNWDPDDIRYSVIRWITDDPSEFGAEAQIVWDPRTGQILRGGVLLDSNLVRNAKRGEDILYPVIADAATADRIVPPEMRHSYAPVNSEYDFGIGEAREAAFGMTALELMGDGMSMDEFSRQRLKAVVMHEIGHSFGLAHNFFGHNAYTAAELRSRSFTLANGTSSSVMDYWPANIWPKGMSSGTWYPLTLGPYDYHAIRWGYASIPGASTPQAELPTLERWASAAVDPRYTFSSDEDGSFDGHAIDPRTSPFVATNRPLDWCAMQLDLSKSLMGRLDNYFPKPQQPWADERNAFLSVLGRYTTCGDTLSHYIAGEYLTRDRIGDRGVDTATKPVPRSEELRAYGLLDKYVLSDTAWQFSARTLNRLTYTEYMPFTDFGYDPGPRHDIPVVELVGAFQNQALGYMFSPLVLQRLADMPTKTPRGTSTMSLADLFAWTQRAVYGDLAGTHPVQSQIHRNLQRRYTRLLAQLITAPFPATPLDAQALARYELTSLQSTIHHALVRQGLDLQSAAHLRDMQLDVARALDAKTVLPAPRPASA